MASANVYVKGLDDLVHRIEATGRNAPNANRQVVRARAILVKQILVNEAKKDAPGGLRNFRGRIGVTYRTRGDSGSGGAYALVRPAPPGGYALLEKGSYKKPGGYPIPRQGRRRRRRGGKFPVLASSGFNSVKDGVVTGPVFHPPVKARRTWTHGLEQVERASAQIHNYASGAYFGPLFKK